jgi:hypothetical protein
MARAMLGEIQLDNVSNEKVNRSINSTDHPIEDGFSITDHIERNPKTLDISGVITGVDAAYRSSKLERYMNEAELLKYTYRNSFVGVIIEKFNSGHGVKVYGGFTFDMSLKLVRTVSKAKVVNISTPVKKVVAKTVSKGRQQPSTNITKNPVYHTIVSGDTYWGLAKKYGTSLSLIQKWNKWDARSIPVGAKVRVG